MDEDPGLSPESPKRFFTHNIIQRVFAYLRGFDGIKHRFLRCTNAGVLKTASVGSGLEYQDVKNGTSTNSYSALALFDQPASQVIIQAWNNDIYVKLNRDGTNYNDPFTVKKDSVWVLDVACYGFSLKSYSAGLHGVYEVQGLW